MKIAFIIDEFPSLSQTFILNQITGLLDRGHEVDIYAIPPENQSVVHADVEKYNLLEHTFYRGFDNEKMPQNIVQRFIKASSFIMQNIHRKPMAFLRALSMFRFGRQAVSLRILYKAFPFLDKEIPDYAIVHCHFGPNGDLGALLKDIGVIKGKVITTFHGYDISKYVKRKGDKVYDHLFEAGDLILPISNRWKDELIKLGCDSQKIIVHRSGGVDTGKIPFAPRRLENDGKIQLITVARFVEKKGIKYAIQAVAKVLQKYPQIEYKIAGDGILRRDIERLIDELNIADNVKLLGWQRQEEIVELMKETHILLAPSVTSEDGDQEGLPAVLIEALAQGIPVISTWHSGIPELIQDGRSGFLVPERDVEALTEKLAYLVEHPDIWPEMGRTGRDYVEKYYDINKLNNQLVALYQQMLG